MNTCCCRCLCSFHGFFGYILVGSLLSVHTLALLGSYQGFAKVRPLMCSCIARPCADLTYV